MKRKHQSVIKKKMLLFGFHPGAVPPHSMKEEKGERRSGLLRRNKGTQRDVPGGFYIPSNTEAGTGKGCQGGLIIGRLELS